MTKLKAQFVKYSQNNDHDPHLLSLHFVRLLAYVAVGLVVTVVFDDHQRLLIGSSNHSHTLTAEWGTGGVLSEVNDF